VNPKLPAPMKAIFAIDFSPGLWEPAKSRMSIAVR